MRRFSVFSAMVVALLISASAWAVTPPTYYLTDLGPGAATAINSAGQVAGYGNGLAYLYNQGVTTPLGTLGGSNSAAFASATTGKWPGTRTPPMAASMRSSTMEP